MLVTEFNRNMTLKLLNLALATLLVFYWLLNLACPFFTSGLLGENSTGNEPIICASICPSLNSIPCGFLTKGLTFRNNSFNSIRSKYNSVHKSYMPNYLVIFLLICGDVEVNPGPSFACFNSQSVHSNANVDKASLLQQYVLDNNIDIFAIQETWLTPYSLQSVLNSVTPDGYVFVHEPRSEQRGGGVGFLINASLGFSRLVLPNFSSFEAIGIKIDLRVESLVCINIYRSPSLPFSGFIADFATLLEDVATSTANVIICGDFNVHWDDLNANETKQLKSLTETFGFFQHVPFATHIGGHTLDLVFSRVGDDKVSQLDCTVMAFSDHFAVSCLIAGPSFNKRPPVVSKVTRTFKNFNVTAFCTDLLQSGLAYLNSYQLDFDLHVNCFYSTIASILEKHAPWKSVRYNNRKKLPYYTNEIREQKKLRSKYESKWRKNKTIGNLIAYKNQAKIAARLLKISKRRYYRKIINENATKPKKLWSILNSVCNRKNQLILPTSISDSVLAKGFSEFFINKIVNLVSKFTPSLVSLATDNVEVNLVPANSLSEFEPATEVEVAEAIKQSSNATCSMDALPTSILKQCLPALIKPITAIVNRCLSDGMFPTAFKKALVKPLIKKLSLPKDDFNSYRPVSNLHFLSKIVERIVHSRLSAHLNKFGALPKFQSAYRPFCSTETALLRIQDDILLGVDQQKVSALVLLDLSAAFDTIDHGILLNRLQSYFGLEGTALNFFRSYLSDRKQSVVIQSSSSDESSITTGVPQGSVLGPLLFSMYTTPLSSLLDSNVVNHHFYADDTQVYISFSAKDQVASLNVLSGILNNIYTWFIDNKLSINPQKTEFLLIGTKQQHSKVSNTSLTIANSVIMPNDKVRNLGVIFDSELSYKAHIKKTCQTSFLYVRLLRTIRDHLDMNSTKLLANALVISRLDYCNSLLYGLPHATLNKLQLVQNSLARVVLPGVKRHDHITPVLKTLHWLPIEKRIKFKVATLTYKALIGQSPIYIQDLVHRLPPSNRRSSGKNLLSCPFIKLSTSRRCFSFAAPTVWNSLPETLRECQSLPSFRKRLKAHLFAS